MTEGKGPHIGDSEAEKLKSIGALGTLGGRGDFFLMFERKMVHLRTVFLEGRGGPKIRAAIQRSIVDMKATADRMRENFPETAEAIDSAREKYKALFEEIKGYNQKELRFKGLVDAVRRAIKRKNSN